MTKIETLQQQIKDLSTVFSQCALESVSNLFGQECEIHMPWEVVEQLQAQFDVILTMGSASREYSSITCAGVQYDSLKVLLSDDNVTREFAADALGEFANTYCAALADNKEYRDIFGVLTQAVPVLYTDGQSFLPFIWGVQGYIYFGQHWLYVGYSLRNNLEVKDDN